MIKSIKITNYLGESITLELRNPEKSGFLIRGIDGLGPGKANISITTIATSDGSMYNSSRINSRNIVLYLTFLEKPTIEDTRLLSYKYFPIKKRITMEIETSSRISSVVGYVESNSPNIFSNQEGTTISIICPDPYFYDLDRQVTTFSDAISVFEFPFSNESLTEKLILISDTLLHTVRTTTYYGDSAVGLIMFLHATGVVTNITIYNLTTRDHITLNATFTDGDDIVISTIKGNKFILLQRNAIISNLLYARSDDSRWIQIEKGDNMFAYTATSGANNLQLRIENQIAYEGV